MSPERKVQEPQNNPEIVRLNQEFQLFPPSSTFILQAQYGEPYIEFTSFKILETGYMPPIPLIVAAQHLVEEGKGVLVPFNPELGYQITDEDFSTDERINKYQRLTAWAKNPNYEKAPLSLYINTVDQNLLDTYLGDAKVRNDLEDKLEVFYDWVYQNDIAIAEIRNLYLKLFFSTMAVGAWFNEGLFHDTDSDGTPEVMFDFFHPLDTGPLPVDAAVLDEREVDVHVEDILAGLSISIPSTYTQVCSIHGEFSIVPHKQHYPQQVWE